MLDNNSLHAGKPQAMAIVVLSGVEPLKRLEQIFHIFHVKAFAMVPNEENRLAVRLDLAAHIDCGQLLAGA